MVTVPGGEIMTALRSGAIDASLAFNSFRAHRTHPLRPAAVRSLPSWFGPGIGPVANLSHHHLRRNGVESGHGAAGPLSGAYRTMPMPLQQGRKCPSRDIAVEIRKRRGWKPTCVIGLAMALDNRASHTSNEDRHPLRPSKHRGRTRNGMPSPRLLGIVNITDDSFSDGGRFLDQHAAISHADNLLEAGADVIDLGAVASNPDSIRSPST